MTEKEHTTRDKIIYAAIKVFGKKGFHGATTKEIAREAGVAEGTIFRYFKSKKDLLVSLATPIVVESLVTLIDEVSTYSDEEIIKAIIYNRLKIFQQHSSLIKLLIYEAQFHPEVRETLFVNVIAKAKGIIEEFIRKRIQEGRYKEVDPGHASRCLAGMVIFMVIWQNISTDSYKGPDLDEQITQIIDIFLHGVTKR